MEVLCAARFKLRAPVSSGGKAGAAAWGTLDFSTGQRWLGMGPEWQAGEGSLCPAYRPLEVVGGGHVYVRLGSFCLCVSWPSAPSTPQSGEAGDGCHSAVGRSRREILPTILEWRHPPQASSAQRMQLDPSSRTQASSSLSLAFYPMGCEWRAGRNISDYTRLCAPGTEI